MTAKLSQGNDTKSARSPSSADLRKLTIKHSELDTARAAVRELTRSVRGLERTVHIAAALASGHDPESVMFRNFHHVQGAILGFPPVESASERIFVLQNKAIYAKNINPTHLKKIAEFLAANARPGSEGAGAIEICTNTGIAHYQSAQPVLRLLKMLDVITAYSPKNGTRPHGKVYHCTAMGEKVLEGFLKTLDPLGLPVQPVTSQTRYGQKSPRGGKLAQAHKAAQK